MRDLAELKRANSPRGLKPSKRDVIGTCHMLPQADQSEATGDYAATRDALIAEASHKLAQERTRDALIAAALAYCYEPAPHSLIRELVQAARAYREAHKP
jgi:hypothetical protein